MNPTVPAGYIGVSTRREVRYAREIGKPVTYTDAPDEAAGTDG